MYCDYHTVFYPAIEEVNFAPYKAQTKRGDGQPLPLASWVYRFDLSGMYETLFYQDNKSRGEEK